MTVDAKIFKDHLIRLLEERKNKETKDPETAFINGFINGQYDALSYAASLAQVIYNELEKEENG